MSNATLPDPALKSETLMLRPREAAQLLGVSERKLWSLTKDRTSGIPCVKLGASVRYPRRQLEAWIESLIGRGTR